MSKTIVFCADGTWDGPEDQTGVAPIDGDDNHGELAAGDVTNVVRLFANLAGQVTPQTLKLGNEQEKVFAASGGRIIQVAKYLHGVGDSSNLITKVLGGVFGIGIVNRIVRGYTFISRNYVPEDEIHITGFSRGAYTARALAGMIAKVGLLNPRAYDPDDKAQAYRLGVTAWCKARQISLQGKSKLTAAASVLLGYIESFVAAQLPSSALIPGVKMKSVGVWDTVGSLGIPAYARNARTDLFEFVDNTLAPEVANGFHAMAIDELRIDFPVTRWDARHGITQVWFVGAHSDIGGGYPLAQCGLSDIAFAWMTQRLAGVGVQFVDPPAYAPSLKNFGEPVHTPWKNPPFDKLATSPRNVLETDAVDDHAVTRWKSDPTYRPASLTAWAKANIR